VTWWQQLLISVTSGATGAAAIYAVAWLNKKGAKEVSDAGTAVQMRSLDQALIDRLQTQIDRQDTRIGVMDKARQDLQVRVDELERSLDREERGRAAAIKYIRKLLDWIAEHMPGHTPPEIPFMLREDLTSQ
jgi:GTP-dependent phosphoenolpyruvate carboxykinase